MIVAAALSAAALVGWCVRACRRNVWTRPPIPEPPSGVTILSGSSYRPVLNDDGTVDLVYMATRRSASTKEARMGPHGTEIAPRLRSWASILDENTREQAEKTARLPIIAGHVALMADAHLGHGATVGSVIATEAAIIPSAVGVDIGCGVAYVPTGVRDAALPDNLGPLRGRLAETIPAGVGQGHDGTTAAADCWFAANPPPTPLSEKDAADAHRQFGSLGSGNHFFEVTVDDLGEVGLLLHSGSRGIGNRLASRWIDRARHLEFTPPIEDPDLAWFQEGTPDFDGYIRDMLWAQAYAYANREAMMDAALDVFRTTLGWSAAATDRSYRAASGGVNVHHNYAARERHFGRDVWVTRKGATRAGAGEVGLIPGSMATGSYLVRGLGNPQSFESCSHGAGRRLSRGAARRELTVESLAAVMAANGVTWQDRDGDALLDEHPDAYKDLQTVMDDQSDLVEVVTRLRAVVNVKGVDRHGRRNRRR